MRTELHISVSRLLALGLLLALIAMLYGLVMLPLQQHYADNQQQLEQLTGKLRNFQRIANSREQTEKLFKEMRPDESTLGYYLKGSTPALASAELQAYARTIVEESKGNLVSTQPLVNGDGSSERMVRVNVRMRGNIDTLRQMFFRIVSGRPALLTDEIFIRLDKSALTRPGDEQTDDTLDVQFTLTGFVKESVS